MLKQWRIKNFKSLKGNQSIELSMVNVIAGANSSGKSSIIQSILLLKQTLQYGSENRAISLNGPILRLGSFEDIINNTVLNEDIYIGFDLGLTRDDDAYNGTTAGWAKTSYNAFRRKGSPSWNNISLGLQFGASNPEFFPGAGNLSPALLTSSLTISGFLEEQYLEQKAVFSFPEYGWKYKVDIDRITESEIMDNMPDGKIEGGIVSYFMPDYVLVQYNQSVLDVDNIVGSIFSTKTNVFLPASATERLASREVVHIANNWLQANNYDPINLTGEPVPISELQMRLSPIARSRSAPSLMGLLEGSDDQKEEDVVRLRENIRASLLSEIEPEFQSTLGQSRGMRFAEEYLSEFLKFGVKYLGPLRDSPRPVYQPEALESTIDVGYRGEHTAAVFEINKHARVEYFKPPLEEGEDNYVSDAIQAETSLAEAAAEWLKYLGVATSVHTVDAGVFGNRMQVAVAEGQKHHDLTNVGVGVSQVLPIVVMALLAPKGSLLIFEQPELHLHPKVQSRLADFFLALACGGKQTILETHSEYLVDRLRFRVASSQDERTLSFINILFSEKKGGCSEIRPVEINEYGAILNWPSDFFEQSQKDVSRILKAASRKRKIKI